jgi:phosphoenolpyruvate-protein phosphotransferase
MNRTPHDVKKHLGLDVMKKFGLTAALLEVFSGERQGSPEEQKQLRHLCTQVGDTIYVEALRFLTPQSVATDQEAKRVFSEIQAHRKMLTAKLCRRVSLQVAALDYSQYILNLIARPGFEDVHADACFCRKILLTEQEALSPKQVSSPGVAYPETQKNKKLAGKRQVHKGLVLAQGLAVGHAFYYQDILTRELEMHDLAASQLHVELQRVVTAIETVERELGGLKQEVEKQVGQDHAAIFDVHKLILKDMNLIEEVEREMKARMINAEHIVRDIFARWERKLRSSESDVIKDKAEDMADIGRRVLRVLIGIQGSVLVKFSKSSIIFTKRLLPSDTVYLDKKKTRGIVVTEGGLNSHAAVLARAMRIPLIVIADLNLGQIPLGRGVVLDGDHGRLIINPTRHEMSVATAEIRTRRRQETLLLKKEFSHQLHYAGEEVCIRANVSSADDVGVACTYGCQGIGLFRIESLYMFSQKLPDEEGLYQALFQALAPLGRRPVTLRFLDIGGDKTLPYMNLTERDDSVLGLRGVRLLLRHPVLLETQMRVFLRLSQTYQIKMLVPMVSVLQDIVAVRNVLEIQKAILIKSHVRFDEKIHLGSMIETPSAMLALDAILQASDFVSIGTNDLLQYTMAADREKASVADYYAAGNVLITAWIHEIATKSRLAHKECTLCGELAGDLRFTRMIFDGGIRRYSVIPQLIPRVKGEIEKIIRKKSPTV